MLKLLCIFILSGLALTACEQQKQASAEVGAIPKTILDKAKNDINAAEALAAQNQKALENVETPADTAK